MARSDVIAAQAKWGRRIAQARAAGVPDSAWQGLMQQDITAIEQQGKTPMADAEVNDAIRAASQRSPIQDPSKGHGPLDILGNIPSDLHDLVTGWPGGVVNYLSSVPEQTGALARLLNPSTHDQEAQQLGMETGSNITDIGGLLRNMGKVPLLSPLVPGVTTASEATTSEGRKSLEEHPVSALVDVGGAVAAAGNVGVFGTPAEVGTEAGVEGADAAEAGAKASKTALQALQEGHPYKAAARAAMTGIENTPRVGEKINRTKLSQLADEFTFSERMRNIARTRDEKLRGAQLDSKEFMLEHFGQFADMTREEQDAFNRVSHGLGTAEDQVWFNAHPEVQQLLLDMRRVDDELVRQSTGYTKVKSKFGEQTYAVNHPVTKAAKKVAKLKKTAAEQAKAYKELDQIARDTANQNGSLHRLTHKAYDRANEMKKHLDATTKKRDDAVAEFNQKLGDNAPEAFYPLVDKLLREKGVNAIQRNTKLSQVQAREAIQHIQHSVDFAAFKKALGNDKLADQLLREAEQSWTKMAEEGANPIFLPNTTASKLSHVAKPTVLPEARYSRVRRQTMFNLSTSVQDVYVGIGELEKQVLSERAQAQWVNEAIKPLSKDSTRVQNDIEDGVLNGGGIIEADQVRAAILDEMSRHWIKWTPELSKKYGLEKYFPGSEGGDIMLPKGVERSLKYLQWGERDNPFFNAYNRSMGVWKFAVLATPRHISHVVLGGLVMGELQDPLFLTKMRSAIGIMRGHDKTYEIKFGKNDNDFKPDQLVLHSSGSHLGQILTKVTNGVDWIRKFEENTTLMYKIAYMLKREEHLVKGGMAGKEARDEAMKQASKVFVSASEMSPIERGVFTKVFPFWAFTRHLLRYAMTYPIDHPYRLAILTNLANQHYADWQSGLPQSLQFMFFLGSPDANGNVGAVDYRSIDPFRSFYNDFTLAGLTQDSNPVAQYVLQEMGVNVLSATPELYTGSHYDPSTGTNVADRPANPILRAFETAVPEVQGADAYLGLSDQYRNLKVSDPEAYKHRVFSTLGIPFGEETINVPRKIADTQMKRYSDAQSSINEAIRTGDFSKAKRYSSVPTPSLLKRYFGNQAYVTPGDVERIYNALRAQADAAGQSGISLHALLPKA